MLSSSLPCTEIIGWHALTAVFMTCFMKTASCIELGVCKGEFCFFALLGTGQRRCLISGRSQPGRLAVFPPVWKKKCYLNREKVLVFWGGFPALLWVFNDMILLFHTPPAT